MHSGALISMEIKNTKIKSTNSYKEFETEEKFKRFLQSSDMILYHIELNQRTEIIFNTIFLKYISEKFESEQKQNIEKVQHNSEQKSSNKLYNGVFVPEFARWSYLRELKNNIGSELNKAFREIEKHNPSLKGTFAFIDYDGCSGLNDINLQQLLSHFSKYSLLSMTTKFPDIIGNTTRYLINWYGKKHPASQTVTPIELTKLMVLLLKPSPNMTIYDPCAGAGNALIETYKYVLKEGGDKRNPSLYGQELNYNTWSICKMNMVINGLHNADIQQGNVLHNPLHNQGNELTKFDRIIAHPPFSLPNWVADTNKSDPYNRFIYGMPPKHNGDLAFLQHMIASLTKKGKLCVLITEKTIFSSLHNKIFKGILKDDLIEAIIELPDNLHFNTTIQTYILVINKNKNSKRRNKILFINSEKEYDSSAFITVLNESNISKVIRLYESLEDEKNNSFYITYDQIKKNDFNIGETLRNILFYKKIDIIKSDYKKYKKYKLSEIGTAVDTTHKNITSLKNLPTPENTVFIPNKLNNASKKNSVIWENEINIFSSKKLRKIPVYLDKKIINSEYLSFFFKSELGQEILKHSERYGNIKTVNIKRLMNSEIFVPPLDEQNKIVQRNRELGFIKTRVYEIEKILEETPANKKQNRILNKIYRSLKDENVIIQKLLADESKTHELKASLKTPYPDSPEIRNHQKVYITKNDDARTPKQMEKILKSMVLKAIVSLLNTQGGTLVIGVDDAKTIVGIEHDKFEDEDKYQRCLIDIIKDSTIGPAISTTYIDIGFVDINPEDISAEIKLEGNTKTVCLVTVKALPLWAELADLDDEIYIRQAANTVSLNGKEAAKYQKLRSEKWASLKSKPKNETDLEQ